MANVSQSWPLPSVKLVKRSALVNGTTWWRRGKAKEVQWARIDPNPLVLALWLAPCTILLRFTNWIGFLDKAISKKESGKLWFYHKSLKRNRNLNANLLVTTFFNLAGSGQFRTGLHHSEVSMRSKYLLLMPICKLGVKRKKKYRVRFKVEGKVYLRDWLTRLPKLIKPLKRG